MGEKDATKQIENKLHTPIENLAEHCWDPEFLASVISLAFNMGIQIGQRRAYTATNRMLKGYSRISLEN